MSAAAHCAPTSARLRHRRHHHRRATSMRLVLLGVLALLALASMTTASAPTAGGLVVVENADDAAATVPSSSATNAPQERIPEFVATDEWKEILPGQGIPRGLHVRLNLETGKREAKLMDPTDTHVDERLRSVVVEQDATVTVATDIGGDVDTVVTKRAAVSNSKAAVAVSAVSADGDAVRSAKNDDTELTVTDESSHDEAPPAREPAWNHEKMYEVLQALPEPPVLDDGMDLHSAYAKLSKAEFRQQIIKLWKQRQADLKEALASMQDDSKYLGSLLEQLRDAERNGSTADMVHVLEVLEWEVQDLDKTHVFNFIGGFDVIATYLNATNLPVRAHASWVVGSAAKNYRDGQNWVINAGALPKLLESLALELPAASDVEHVSERLRDVFEVKKKALYAISSLVLFNARGQRLFALHNGPELLATVFDSVLHPTSVKLKAALLIHDLLLETDSVEAVASDSETSLQQLQRVFRSSEWCERLSSFFLEHSSKLRQRQALEILGAMRNQLPACRETFRSAGVKSAVEGVAVAFEQDSGLDDDEKRDILVFVNEFVGLL